MAIAQYFEQYTRNETGSEYVPLIKEFAHGCVISVGSRTAQIMSDIWDTEYYAEYWDDNANMVKTIGLYCANESGEWYRKSWAEVDATDEVWAKVEKFWYDREYSRRENDALKEAQTIRKDSLVKVTGGRFNKGESGKVVVVIQRPYGMGYRSYMADKLGIATSDVMVDKIVKGRVYKNYRDVVWAWARNCELTVTPDIDTAKIVEFCTEFAKYKVEQAKKNALAMPRTYNRAA